MRGALLIFIGLSACAREPANSFEPTFGAHPKVDPGTIEYSFGVFPLHSTERLFELYQPLIDTVNARSQGFALRLEAGRDYGSYETKLSTRQLAFALVNPYQAVEAERKGYRIFAKMGGELRGIIVVRKDAAIRSVEDLRGANVSFPAPTAFAATMLNKMMFKRLGLDVAHDATASFVGSQDSAIMNVYLRLTKAGGTWPPAWNALTKSKPEVAAELEVKWQTPPMPSLAVAARDDVPDGHVRAVSDIALSLATSAEGRAILARIEAPGFEAATSQSYDTVRTLVADYRRDFPEDGR